MLPPEHRESSGFGHGEDVNEPWFLYPGWRLRAWQLVDTPAAFKSRNIFGGDRILARA